MYFEHLDSVDTREALSKFHLIFFSSTDTCIGTFLVNNYKQALDILSTASASPSQFPSDTSFEKWLEEEYQYLSSRASTPPDEEWRIEYYKKLIALTDEEYACSDPLATLIL